MAQPFDGIIEGMFAALLVQLATPDLDRYLDDPVMRGAIVTACVTDLNGSELYSRNADLRIMPGSNQKLLTAAFALERLGPSFRPATHFWKEKGRIVVHSAGDPFMTRSRLLDIRKSLELKGNLPVAVRQEFGPLYPAGWEWDDLPNRYAPMISAFTIDRGGFELWAENGRPELVPENFGVRIVRDTGAPSIHYDPRSGVLRISGPLPILRTRLDTLSIPSPDRAAAKILGSHLRAISFLPSRPADLVSEGQSLQEVLTEALPPSDNGVFEALLLMAAGIKQEDRDPYVRARGELSKFLRESVGLEDWQTEPFDGSGLSRHNMVTTRAISKLLVWSETRPTRLVWRASLARPGSGTLKARLDAVPFEGKTGTLDKVTALSGYLTPPNGRTLIVSIIVNHQAVSTAEARAFVDGFVRKLLEIAQRGTLLAIDTSRASIDPDSSIGASTRNWFPRSRFNGRSSSIWLDPGDESAHENLHRAKRVAVRPR